MLHVIFKGVLIVIRYVRDLNMNQIICHFCYLQYIFPNFRRNIWDNAKTEMVFYPVVISAVNVSRHPKVPDLHHLTVSNQTVPGGQVSVDEMKGSEVHHARGNLSCEVEHLRKSQLTHQRNLHLIQDTSIWTVSPVQKPHTL